MKPRRFRATIRKQGPNPYVDIPPEISRGFARYARVGRIRVEGRLEEAAIRGTLIPVGGGRHRLYLTAACAARRASPPATPCH